MMTVPRCLALLLCLLLVASPPASAKTDEARTWYDAEDDTVHLRWPADADATGYDVLRNGDLLATLPAGRTSYVDAEPIDAALYEVRATGEETVAWVYEVLVVVLDKVVDGATDPDTPRWLAWPPAPVDYDMADLPPGCSWISFTGGFPVGMPIVYEACLLTLVPPLPPVFDGPHLDTFVDMDTFLDD